MPLKILKVILIRRSLNFLNVAFPDKTPEDILSQAMTTFGSVCMSAGETTRDLENGSEPVKTETPEKPKSVQSSAESSIPILAAPSVDWGSRIAGVLICGLGHLLLGEIPKGSLFLALFIISILLLFFFSGTVFVLAGISALVIWAINVADLWTITSS